MEEVKITQISDHVYASSMEETHDRPHLYLIVSAGESLMIDAGNSPAHARAFLSLADEMHLPMPKLLCLTHWHWDHSFGGAAIACNEAAGEKTIAVLKEISTYSYSDEAIHDRVLKGTENDFVEGCMKLEYTPEQRESMNIRIPDEVLHDKQNIPVGRILVEVHQVASDHSDENLTFLVREDSLLITGDLLYEDFYHGNAHYTTKGVRALQEGLREIPAEWFACSHNKNLITRDEVREFCRCLLNEKRLVLGEMNRYEPVCE
ncbi:MAG: MBL fold metallo-hydrolase [Bulleidia sp.]|nr:MBL fold metallo-hydrolase [Bulleidia sp.]